LLLSRKVNKTTTH